MEFRPENLNGNLRQVLLITLIFLENHCQQTFKKIQNNKDIVIFMLKIHNLVQPQFLLFCANIQDFVWLKFCCGKGVLIFAVFRKKLFLRYFQFSVRPKEIFRQYFAKVKRYWIPRSMPKYTSTSTPVIVRRKWNSCHSLACPSSFGCITSDRELKHSSVALNEKCRKDFSTARKFFPDKNYEKIELLNRESNDP